jgi:hypothetical protein
MNWVRVETRFISHPKVLDIGPLGEALWLRGLCYAGEQLTDGFVPSSFIKRMGDMKGVVIAARLVSAGLWDEEDGGYVIHDFLDWQRSRDEVSETSSKRAVAGRLGGKQRASNLLAKSKQNESKIQPYVEGYVEGEGEEEQNLNGFVSPKPPKSRSVKTPVPDDLAGTIPTDVWSGIADEQQLTGDQLRFETSLLIDHYRGKAERRADWVATWRNWMRSPYRQTKPTNLAPTPFARPKTDADKAREKLAYLDDPNGWEHHDRQRYKGDAGLDMLNRDRTTCRAILAGEAA